MRVLFRIALTLLIALPILLALPVLWALQGGRAAAPNLERAESISAGGDLFA